MINKDLIDILVCPQCKGPVTLMESKLGLLCGQCKLIFEIRDDIPIMLVDEAKKIIDDEV